MRIKHRIEEWKIANYDEPASVFETKLQLTLLLIKILVRVTSRHLFLKRFYC